MSCINIILSVRKQQVGSLVCLVYTRDCCMCNNNNNIMEVGRERGKGKEERENEMAIVIALERIIIILQFSVHCVYTLLYIHCWLDVEFDLTGCLRVERKNKAVPVIFFFFFIFVFVYYCFYYIIYNTFSSFLSYFISYFSFCVIIYSSCDM